MWLNIRLIYWVRLPNLHTFIQNKTLKAEPRVPSNIHFRETHQWSLLQSMLHVPSIPVDDRKEVGGLVLRPKDLQGPPCLQVEVAKLSWRLSSLNGKRSWFRPSNFNLPCFLAVRHWAQLRWYHVGNTHCSLGKKKIGVRWIL